MQPRTLDQILSQLDTIYKPQIASAQAQLDQVPQQAQAEEAGLQAKQTQAFGDILNGARRRGLGFSGIPLADQAKYTATDYLPALANLHTAQQQRAQSLQDAIFGIQERQGTTAQQIYQQEQDRAAQLAAAKAQSDAYSGLFNQQQSQQQQSPLTLQGVTLKNAQQGGQGGYNFAFGNKPISAVGFAQVNGLNPADILYTMAQNGDAYAANAYRDILGNNGQITPDLARKYSALFWGTNFIPAQPAPKPKPKSTSNSIVSQPTTMFSASNPFLSNLR